MGGIPDTAVRHDMCHSHAYCSGLWVLDWCHNTIQGMLVVVVVVVNYYNFEVSHPHCVDQLYN